VDTTLYSAYNAASKRFISSGLQIVDAALEPFKVLKLLMDGLAPVDARAGLWLTHFQGVPVARSRNPFDLIYLDEGYHVIHTIEISLNSAFAPFRGNPASALILPAKSIAASKTFTGDRIVFRIVEQAASQPEAPTPQRAPNLNIPNRVVPAAAPRAFRVPQERFQSTSSSTSSLSGPLLRNRYAASEMAPGLRQAVDTQESAVNPNPPGEPLPQSDANEVTANEAAPIAHFPDAVELFSAVDLPPLPQTDEVTANEPAPIVHFPVEVGLSPAVDLPPLPQTDEETANEPAPVVHFPDAVELFSAVDRPPLPQTDAYEVTANEAAPVVHFPDAVELFSAVDLPPLPQTDEVTVNEAAPIVVSPVEADLSSAADRPLDTHVASSTNVAPIEKESSPAQQIPRDDGQIFSPSDDHARWLQPQAEQIGNEWKGISSTLEKHSWDVRLLYLLFPDLDPSNKPKLNGQGNDTQQIGEKRSKKLQVLSWLYPDLQLEGERKKPRRPRRAPRIPVPGLVGFYFAGGPSTPHEIRNLSVMGFYMVTRERWMPGTIIRVTLQMLGSDGENPNDTITMLSRVVNWGPDGGGFEFVYPGSID
jgi:hypothetical protein